ncbi:MAG: FAD-binding protein [Armatimonadota bacterium]|nr:FAD-binding protein [Armatimonadota bacterium]
MTQRSIIDCDVVVLGTGAAGMMAALSAAEAGAEVYCVSKMAPRAPSCTTRAYGDITWSTDETADELFRQVVETGGFLGNQKLVRRFAQRVPSALSALTAIGIELDEPRPAGDGMPGTVRWSYRGADSGQELLDEVGDEASRAGARFMYGLVATELLVGDGGIGGLATISLKARQPVIFSAPQVVIATGGGACLYPRADNPGGTTGDGIVMAYEAGAELVDLELITFAYPPKRVADVLQRGEELRDELLGLGHAHYFLGGVRIDAEGAGSVPGLMAAGEASGGLFGAGRLGGSALGDCFVFGRDVGRAAAIAAEDRDARDLSDDLIDAACQRINEILRGEDDPAPVAERIREIAWQGIGPVKTEASITRALAELDAIDPHRDGLGGADRDSIRTAVEARNMHMLAWLVATASLKRKETRGCYWRADHSEPDNETQLRNIVLRKGASGCEVTSQPPVMTELREPSHPRIGAGCFGYISRDR